MCSNLNILEPFNLILELAFKMYLYPVMHICNFSSVKQSFLSFPPLAAQLELFAQINTEH